MSSLLSGSLPIAGKTVKAYMLHQRNFLAVGILIATLIQWISALHHSRDARTGVRGAQKARFLSTGAIRDNVQRPLKANTPYRNADCIDKENLSFMDCTDDIKDSVRKLLQLYERSFREWRT